MNPFLDGCGWNHPCPAKKHIPFINQFQQIC
jgi:hypothetical protein